MWYKIHLHQVELRIFVKPNAKRTVLVGVSEDELHIALHAKPKEGEANKELVAYLAKMLKVPKSHIVVIQGDKSRHKVVAVPINETVRQFLVYPTDFFI